MADGISIKEQKVSKIIAKIKNRHSTQKEQLQVIKAKPVGGEPDNKVMAVKVGNEVNVFQSSPSAQESGTADAVAKMAGLDKAPKTAINSVVAEMPESKNKAEGMEKAWQVPGMVPPKKKPDAGTVKRLSSLAKAGYDCMDKSKGLYANIHARREKGLAPKKPGQEGYPADKAFKDAEKTAKSQPLPNESMQDDNSHMNSNLLEQVKHHVAEIESSFDFNQDLPDWVDSLIVEASDRLSTVSHFIQGEKKNLDSLNKSISAPAMESGEYKGEPLQPEHHMRLHKEYKIMAKQALHQQQPLKARIFMKKSKEHLEHYHAGQQPQPVEKAQQEPEWHAQYKGKMYPVTNIVDSGKPAHEGGGNMYHLQGLDSPVHQSEIEDLVHSSDMQEQNGLKKSVIIL